MRFLLLFTACGALLAQRGPGGPGGFMRFSPVLSALDADHDGVISAEEIKNAPKALAKLDKNGDGQLSAEELRPNMEGRGGPGGEGRGPGGPGRMDASEMVKMLMGFDANGDGKLSKDEVPERMQGIFARGDANKDGFLTKDEIEKLAASQGGQGGGGRGEGRGERRGDGPGPGGPPRDRVAMAIDADHDGVISASEMKNAAAALKTLDANGDGRLTEDEVRPPGGPGGPGGPGRGNPDEMVSRMMEQFDTNGDRKISKSEAPERMQEMFDRADTNKDGFLSKDELKAMMQAQRREE